MLARSTLVTIASLALAVMAACARGSPVTYVFEGTATGQAPEDFDHAHFTITLSADTDSINQVGEKIFEVPTEGVIHIDGLGTGLIQEDLHLWSDFTNALNGDAPHLAAQPPHDVHSVSLRSKSSSPRKPSLVALRIALSLRSSRIGLRSSCCQYRANARGMRRVLCVIDT